MEHGVILVFHRVPVFLRPQSKSKRDLTGAVLDGIPLSLASYPISLNHLFLTEIRT